MDQSHHNRPGKEPGKCFLGSCSPSVQFHTLLFCRHGIKRNSWRPLNANAKKCSFKSEMRLSWCLWGLEFTHLRNIPTPAPQVAAWAVQAPTSSPSSWVRQQELWEHSIAPQNRHSVGCFLSSSVDLGHLRNSEEPSTLNNLMGCYRNGYEKGCSCSLTENDWLDLREHCNPLEDQSDDSVSSGILMEGKKGLAFHLSNRPKQLQNSNNKA